MLSVVCTALAAVSLHGRPRIATPRAPVSMALPAESAFQLFQAAAGAVQIGQAAVGAADAVSLGQAAVDAAQSAPQPALVQAAADAVQAVPPPGLGLSASDPFVALAFRAADEAIKWIVPAGLVFGAVSIANSGKDDDDTEAALLQVLSRRSDVSELLKVDVLDSKLESFDYSFTKAEVSQPEALRRKQLADLSRAFGAIGDLDKGQLQRLRKADGRLRARSARIARKVSLLLPQLRTLAVDLGGEETDGGDYDYDGEEEDEADAEADAQGEAEQAAPSLAHDARDASFAEGTGIAGVLSSLFRSEASQEYELVKAELSRLAAAATQLEADFLREVSETLSAAQRRRLRELLSKPRRRGGRGLLSLIGRGQELNAPSWTDGTVDALSPLYSLEGAAELTHAAAAGGVPHASAEAAPPRRVFVLTFDGDVQASQVANLREEVTGVLRSSAPGDEVLLKLNTGGGTVTGYGLAASQLERVKSAGLTLTICVEEVAASGGYMMACVASPGRLFASPFAVLGSIGVISEQPNVYKRLRKEGISFLTVTAGKFKRTLTPTKKPSRKDFLKQQNDIEQVLTLFKTFVARNRPQLDIETVATGETWFGPDALQRNLVDALRTSDDVILDRAKHVGTRVYNVRYQPRSPAAGLAALLESGDGDARGAGRGARGMLGLLVNRLARAVAAELTSAAADELARAAGSSALGGGGSGPSARLYADQILAKGEDTSRTMLR